MNRPLRFVLISKVGHPWFDEVHRGALEQARLLGRLGRHVSVEYLAPASADLAAQSAVLTRAASTNPDGIAIDPVEALSHLEALRAARDRGIPIIVFDSPSPEPGMTSVGNDFLEQGTLAAVRLLALLNGSGKVAVMQGVPSAPNHRQRFEAQVAVLKAHPGITLVDGGADHDDIPTAQRQAAAVLAANPDLRGYLCCDASGPIGIAQAIRDAGRVGAVKVVGMDGIPPILKAIRDGVIESSASTLPRMQGSMSVLMLWQATLGVPLPRRVDTGIELITGENVGRFLAEV